VSLKILIYSTVVKSLNELGSYIIGNLLKHIKSRWGLLNLAMVGREGKFGCLTTVV